MTRAASVATIPRRALNRLRSETRVFMARDDLVELTTLFHTDKQSVHGYMEHYARHLAAHRRSARSVLEIGIGSGRRGSLGMWRAYFRKATIYGMDLNAEDSTDRRIRILQGDQGDRDDLLRVADVVGSADVIIDDGSHVNSHVRLTFQTLFPRLAPGGCYVIEDLHTAYRASHGGSPPGTNTDETSIGLLKTLLDGLNHEHFGSDGYEPTYADRHVTAVHAYEKIAFIEKREAGAA
jgi:hypothetical protein